MTGIALIDVAIGVIFAILTFSLIASSLQEAMASIFNWRGRLLRRGLFRLLESAPVSKKLIETSFFLPTGMSKKSPLHDVRLTFDFLNNPSIQALQGSKSFIGGLWDSLTGSGNGDAAAQANADRTAARSEARAQYRQSMQENEDQLKADGDQDRYDTRKKQLAAWMSRREVGIEDETAIPTNGMDGHGRMPSAIPKETFATALLETLYTRAEAQFEHAITEARAKAETARTETQAAVEAAVRQAQASNQNAPGDLQKFTDNAQVMLHGIAAPEVAYGKTFAQEMAKNADLALETVRPLIDALPMDKRLKDRVKSILKDLSISRELHAQLDNLDDLFEAGEAKLQQQLAQIDAKVELVRQEIGEWFDRSMDRVTGWYVRRAKYVLFAIGLFMACVVNFDLIGYSGQLLRDEQLRQRIVGQAETSVAAEAVAGLQVQRQTGLIFAVLETNTTRDGEISDNEFTQNQSRIQTATRRELGLPANPSDPISDDQKTAAIATLNETLKSMAGAFPTDSNGDGTIDDAERTAAADAYIKNVQAQYGQSVEVLKTQFADQGVHMGRTCKKRKAQDGESWLWALWSDSWTKCVLDQWSWPAFLSWLMIGLGCTMGGQFWFDLLKSVFRVRAAASGLNSDLKKLAGGVPASGQGAGGQSSPPTA